MVPLSGCVSSSLNGKTKTVLTLIVSSDSCSLTTKIVSTALTGNGMAIVAENKSNWDNRADLLRVKSVTG